MSEIVYLRPLEEPSESPYALIECDPTVVGTEVNLHAAGKTIRVRPESLAATISDVRQSLQNAKMYVRGAPDTAYTR
jgi:hypothetical protein